MGRKRQYLNNADLYAEIVKSKEQDELTPKALEFLMLLAEKVSKKLYYQSKEDEEDCIATAKMDLWQYWRSFDPTKGTNAFAYYTEIAKRGLAKGWKKLHPEKYKGTLFLNSTNNGDGIYSI